MDFTPTQEQAAAQELAARIFGDLATHERLSAAGTGSDPELWKALCGAGLVGAVQEVGLLGLVLLLEEQGRTTAQVPFAATCVYGLLAVSAHGSAEQRERLLPGITDGSVVVGGGFPAQGGVRASARGEPPAGHQQGVQAPHQQGVRAPRQQGVRDPHQQDVRPSTHAELTGTVPVVPWLRDATHVLVADADRNLWLVRAGDAEWQPVELTAPWAAGRLVLDGAEAEQLGGSDAYADVLATARTAFAGLQAGVCAGSLARAVAHTNTREQFGRPLATKQAVQLRAADAYMDTEAIRVTAYEAAWRRDTGLACTSHALTAAWWASEAGRRVVHTGQHLHGGAGADLDHPVHRHFLWGRQLDAYLGCGDELLQELGELIKEGEEVDAWDR
ncbi:acyl-CoA dehydrogenase family protein [Streptomyces sp. GESEQ-35]|uniref:acyl-CoA dehydrogenase family protein n=1 Tax=Streptomyces sp. GESEQ-35 TaxID=2812657 RepID=UPI001B319D2B|nr:acyl-CoA dehydrogenase family protein [Streptomyces sp. GESEQ-35]